MRGDRALEQAVVERPRAAHPRLELGVVFVRVVCVRVDEHAVCVQVKMVSCYYLN